MIDPLTRDAAVDVLDGWAGAAVAVRVVAGGDELLAVWSGRLGERSAEKEPALFWPLSPSAGGDERPGVYLHDELFEEAGLHVGSTVLELRQRGVTLNVRRL